MLVGASLLAGMGAFLAHAFLGTPEWPAALFVWLGAAGSLPRVDGPTRRLTLILLAAGLVAEGVGLLRGGSPDPVAMMVINLPIVGLFIGVAFLSLVGAGASATDGPSARDRLWPTLGAIHLLGAVINLSMAAIAGDRMAQDGRLPRREAVVIARAYCAAAFWSPFFVAAAVVHTYAPEARPIVTVPLGLLAALAGLLLTAREVRRLEPGRAFPGFRPDRHSLVLTAVLLAAVLAGKAVFADLPMVVIVTAVTPPVALALMRAGDRRGATARLLGATLPSTAGQVVLFLAAGVFAHGIGTALDGLLAGGASGIAPGPWLYPLVTASILAAAYGGVHPVISIAASATLLAPFGADPSLLAFAFLAGWAIGTAVAPLSGMNLFLIGRFRLRARELLRWGPGYAARMLIVVAVLSWLGAEGIALLEASVPFG